MLGAIQTDVVMRVPKLELSSLYTTLSKSRHTGMDAGIQRHGR